MRPTILIDVDGVIANFLGETIYRLNYCMGLPVPYSESDWPAWSILEVLSPEVQTAAREIWHESGFAYSIPAYFGAIDGVKRMATIADVYFVTSPLKNSQTWAFDRERWLKYWFGDDLGSHVIHTHHKHMVRGDMLIDDKPSHVEEFLETGRTARLFRRSYNDGLTLPYVNDWNEVYDDVDDLITQRIKEADNTYWREAARNLP